MHKDDISKQEATLSEDISKRCFVEMFATENWVYYSSAVTSNLDYWIDRFLLAHARIPSLVNNAANKKIKITAFVPLEVLRWRDGALLAEGVLFSNGAVVIFTSPQKQLQLLFLDKGTINLYKYPHNFIDPRAQTHDNQNTQSEH